MSAFIAARRFGKDNTCCAAYSVYDMGELLTSKAVTIPGISEHRALLMAAWSVLHYIIVHKLSSYDLSIYSDDKNICDELTKVWYGEDILKYEDDDRMVKVINDCCNVASVAFSVCEPDKDADESSYSHRMADLVAEITITDKVPTAQV